MFRPSTAPRWNTVISSFLPVPAAAAVRARNDGANPKVIAETVATPLEEAINGVEGLLYMSSQATTDGLMTLNVTFKLGTDPDKAQQLVQNRVAQAEARLPEEVRRLGLATEPLDEVGIDCELGEQHLDRDVAAQPGVLREIDITHPATAKQRQDAVGIDGRAHPRRARFFAG